MHSQTLAPNNRIHATISTGGLPIRMLLLQGSAIALAG